jgi:hypothetical protein
VVVVLPGAVTFLVGIVEQQTATAAAKLTMHKASSGASGVR